MAVAPSLGIRPAVVDGIDLPDVLELRIRSPTEHLETSICVRCHNGIPEQ